MSIFAARARAAVKPLVIVLEGDGAWFPVGVPLDGVDLCKEGSLALASGPQKLPAPYNPGSRGWVGVSRGRGEEAVAPDRGLKARPLPADQPRSLGKALLLISYWAGDLRSP